MGTGIGFQRSDEKILFYRGKTRAARKFNTIATLWPSGLTGSRDSLGQALDSWHSVSYVSYLLICGRKFITLVSAILLGKLVIFILTSILFSFRRISDILN